MINSLPTLKQQRNLKQSVQGAHSHYCIAAMRDKMRVSPYITTSHGNAQMRCGDIHFEWHPNAASLQSTTFTSMLTLGAELDRSNSPNEFNGAALQPRAECLDHSCGVVPQFSNLKIQVKQKNGIQETAVAPSEDLSATVLPPIAFQRAVRIPEQ